MFGGTAGLIIQLIGNVVGGLVKQLDLGPIWNSVAGIVGGGLGGQLLGVVLAKLGGALPHPAALMSARSLDPGNQTGAAEVPQLRVFPEEASGALRRLTLGGGRWNASSKAVYRIVPQGVGNGCHIANAVVSFLSTRRPAVSEQFVS